MCSASNLSGSRWLIQQAAKLSGLTATRLQGGVDMRLTIEQKLELFEFGYYVFKPPPVVHNLWSARDWVNYIDNGGGKWKVPEKRFLTGDGAKYMTKEAALLHVSALHQATGAIASVVEV
jgi:hypothetical protein